MMITTSNKPARQADSETLGQDTLPAWFDDPEIQERVARLIASAAMAPPRPLSGASQGMDLPRRQLAEPFAGSPE